MYETGEMPAWQSVELLPSTYSAAMRDDDAFLAMESRLAGLLPRLNERDRRLALATEARWWGHGGIAAVHRATGASRGTIRRGLTELDEEPSTQPNRVRASGGGRKKAEVADPELLDRLDSLIEPGTRGDPLTVWALVFRPLSTLDEPGGSPRRPPQPERLTHAAPRLPARPAPSAARPPDQAARLRPGAGRRRAGGSGRGVRIRTRAAHPPAGLPPGSADGGA